jgi:hypothetical protein
MPPGEGFKSILEKEIEERFFSIDKQCPIQDLPQVSRHPLFSVIPLTSLATNYLSHHHCDAKIHAVFKIYNTKQ